jgi:hypothetical protein
VCVCGFALTAATDAPREDPCMHVLRYERSRAQCEGMGLVYEPTAAERMARAALLRALPVMCSHRTSDGGGGCGGGSGGRQPGR